MTTFRIGELEVTRVEDFIMPQVPMKSLLRSLRTGHPEQSALAGASFL